MRILLLPLTGALLVAGCHKPEPADNSLDKMDSALINGAVTAERSALAGAIKVDPARLRAGMQERPATTSLADLAREQAAPAAAKPAGEAPGDTSGVDPAIAQGLAYSNDWAKKLPADLPVMAGATLQEAAGRDGARGAMRVVSFTAPGDRSAVLAWYAQKARAAGYSAERGEKDGDLVLQGSRADGSLYVIMAGAPTGGRTPVDYVWAKS